VYLRNLSADSSRKESAALLKGRVRLIAQTNFVFQVVRMVVESFPGVKNLIMDSEGALDEG
jgi:hypothetical protein